MAEETKQATLNLSNLSPAPGSRHRRKRKGIGEGSGNGKTAGKGQKGARARSGYGAKAGFEGGQMPLHRRLPKRGFTSRRKVRGVNVFSLVSLQQLNSLEESGDITIELLRERGMIRGNNARVKILGGAEVQKKFVVEAHAVSASARAAIESAGGEVRIVNL